MTHCLPRFAAVLLSICFAGASHAQNHTLTPAAPTSADNIRLTIDWRSCGATSSYIGDPYRVRMEANVITVTLGERLILPEPLCPPPGPPEEIDLGRLPAGNYTLNVVETTRSRAPGFEVTNVPFTVSDARALKSLPYARLDQSGHWWDPNDGGWGLFIWQDARDNLLAAWFSYTPEGKPMWYVFQPKFATMNATADADIVQLSRLPGPTSPPPGPGVVVAVGKAKIDFTGAAYSNRATLTYSLNGGPQLIRTIQRFGS